MRQKAEGFQEGFQKGLKQGLELMRRKGSLASAIVVKRLELGLPKLSFDHLIDFSDDELRRMLSNLDGE